MDHGSLQQPKNGAGFAKHHPVIHMRFLVHQLLFVPLIVLVSLATTRGEEQAVPDYQKTIQPILVRYCTGCHNSQDMEGELSLDSYVSLQKGGAEGPIVRAGEPKESRLIKLLTGDDSLS